MGLLRRITLTAAAAAGAAAITALAAGPAAAQASSPFLGDLHSTRILASTVPSNGDVNPYGVAVVRQSQGDLQAGHVLVSNFNDKQNIQGTGTTIVQVSPGGAVSQFARISASSLHGACPGGVGLTTALDILPGGWVVVGSLPTAKKGTVFTGSGCLIVLNSYGNVVETIAGHGINGPWDMAAAGHGSQVQLFVTNVLNGTAAAHGKVVHRGTVLRLDLRDCGNRPPRLESVTTIGSGFAEVTNPAALVIGPTGVALGADGTLYVADTLADRLAAIPGAAYRTGSDGRGSTVSQGGALSQPLGVTTAPGGDILSVNAGNGLIVETTPGGSQVATRQLDSSGSPPGAGALFGLAVTPCRNGVYYVDDATNTLDLLF